MSNKQYQRMDVDTRRRQLLEVGCELFATHPYDEVWIDDVAEKAQVSRGLLYHYFGSKRGFLHAVVEHETKTLLHVTEPDAGLPPVERLSQGLDAYFDYVAKHPHGYRAIFRGVPGSDSVVRELVERNLQLQEHRLISALTSETPPPEALRLVVHGWMSFLVAIALDWLDNETIDATALRDFCVNALVSLLESNAIFVPGGQHQFTKAEDATIQKPASLI